MSPYGSSAKDFSYMANRYSVEELTGAGKLLDQTYSFQVGGKPDFSEPVVLSADRGGVTVEHMCNQIHRSLALNLNYGLVWGTSSKHYPQRYSLGWSYLLNSTLLFKLAPFAVLHSFFELETSNLHVMLRMKYHMYICRWPRLQKQGCIRIESIRGGKMTNHYVDERRATIFSLLQMWIEPRVGGWRCSATSKDQGSYNRGWARTIQDQERQANKNSG